MAKLTTYRKMIGQFISIEGIEGVGKSTCLNYIQEFLASHGIDSLITREPGGTELAEDIRQLLLSPDKEQVFAHTELLLLGAARNQHINLVIQPAIKQGKWVICDRYIDATYAYQSGGRGLKPQLIDSMTKLLENYIQPNISFLLDADIETAFARVHKRALPKDRFEQQNQEFFLAVRETYLKRTSEDPERIKIIDAHQDIESVKQQILGHLVRLTKCDG